MKKIILTLLLTLSALVNVNAVAAFSLDIDGNGTINASNDGLIIFKYLLNSNANNLHTTISSNAADDRKTTAQLKAYLDNAGDILDIDGNGTTNASNDGLIVFKYLLNSNANNLHTTIASNAPGSKTTTINLKAYLDQYTNTDVSNLYSGDRPTELTAEQIADANGAADDSNAHLTVLRYANFGDYVVNILSNKIVIRDESDNYAIVYEITSSENNLAQLDDAEFQALYLEVIQAIWDLVNPAVESRLDELKSILIQNGATFVEFFEPASSSAMEVTITWVSKDGITDSHSFGEFDTLDDVEPWADALQAFENYLNPPTAAEELVAIFALATSPTAFVDYPALDAEADGILQAERAQHIVDSLTNLNGVTVTYTINTTPKSFNVAKAGETTINVLQDSSSGSAVSLDTLSVFKDIYFQTIQAKWDILHPVLTPAEIKAANEKRITDLNGQYGVTSMSPNSSNGELNAVYIQNGSSVQSFLFGTYADFGVIPQTVFDTKFDELEAQLIAEAKAANELKITNLVGSYSVTAITISDSNGLYADYEQTGVTNSAGGSIISFYFGSFANFGVIDQVTYDTKFDELVAKLIADEVTGPTSHADRAAVLTAYNSIDGISNLTVKIASEGEANASVYLTWDLNGTAQAFWNFSATNPTSTTDGDVPGDLSALSPEQFETYRERLYNHLINSLLTPLEQAIAAIYDADVPPTELGTIINDAALAVEYGGTVGHNPRTNFMKSLAYFDVSVNFVFNYPDKPSEVELSNGNIVPNIGTNSSINNMNPAQFAVFAFEVVKRFWHIGHPTYAADQAKAQLRADRIAKVKTLGNTDVTIVEDYDAVRGDLFRISNGNSTHDIYVDGYGNNNGIIEDLEETTGYVDLKNAVITKVGDLDPANAIYGFTPSEFNAATLNEKVNKAYDIGKANDDIQAVSGSLLTGVFSGDKITIRVGARNYPLNILTEMAHDADYEGWKTFIDRILYLVKTGDGSERTIRENHINGIAGNISVKDLDGGDDDWAVAWNDLPFIYGGSDENDHDTSYDTHGNTSRVFAGYHQDNIGLLPGIIYEALLIEIDRIDGYVIAADALRRHADGGINKEREVGLKLLTGDAAFDESASAEWFVLNSDVTVWTNSKYGPICDVPGYLWLGVMDNYSFRYMYIIIRNELLRNADGTRYYNNVNQNIYCGG